MILVGSQIWMEMTIDVIQLETNGLFLEEEIGGKMQTYVF